MQFNGESVIKTQIQDVWEYVSDPKNALDYVPRMKEVNVHSDDRFSIVVGTLIGSISGTFKLQVEIIEEIPPRHVKFKARGKGLKSTVNGEATVDLITASNHSTNLKWSADGNIGGLIAGVGQRLLTMAADKTVKEVFKGLRKKLEGTSK